MYTLPSGVWLILTLILIFIILVLFIVQPSFDAADYVIHETVFARTANLRLRKARNISLNVIYSQPLSYS